MPELKFHPLCSEPLQFVAFADEDSGVFPFITRTGGNLVAKRTAVFSQCERYRYRLTIQWDVDLPSINFLMLNPSTADEMKDDPTVAKCRKLAEAWGFGNVVITNLFAWRATDPKAMMRAEDPVGDANDIFIMEAARQADRVICAWGRDGNYRDRADHVFQILRGWRQKLHALKVSVREPWHPLYLRNDTEPFVYERKEARDAR